MLLVHYQRKFWKEAGKGEEECPAWTLRMGWRESQSGPEYWVLGADGGALLGPE